MSKRKVKAIPPSPEKLSAIERIAVFTERTRLDEYVQLMQNPRRLAWLNFMAGIWRGVGMVIGGSIVGVLVLFLLLQAMRYAFAHAGGLPWIGQEAEELLGWVLSVVDRHETSQ